MPLLTEEKQKAAQRRQWNGRWLYPFFVFPGLLVLLLVFAAIRPLQFGPIVVMVDHFRSPGCGWSVYLGPSTGARVTYLGEQPYAVTGRGQGLAFSLGNRLVGVGWFLGHPLPK